MHSTVMLYELHLPNVMLANRWLWSKMNRLLMMKKILNTGSWVWVWLQQELYLVDLMMPSETDVAQGCYNKSTYDANNISLQDVASRPWQRCKPQRDQEKVENGSWLPPRGTRYPGGDNLKIALHFGTCLQLQPEGSFEKKIVKESKKSLVDLTAFVGTISKQL